MRKTSSLYLVTGAFVLFSIMDVTSAPLPPGTLLPIDPGVGSAIDKPCAVGSCFGVSLPVWNGSNSIWTTFWTDIASGTDGGIIVGKDQKSGGQETGPSGSNSTSGELTAAWFFVNNNIPVLPWPTMVYGTFFTAPGWFIESGGALNVFDDESCARETCLGKTEIKVLNLAIDGNVFTLGSARACNQILAPTICPPDDPLKYIRINSYFIDRVSGAWSLDYNSVATVSVGLGHPVAIPVRVLFRHMINAVPVAADLALATVSGEALTWTPAVSDANGDPLTCSLISPPVIPGIPVNGIATVASDCSSGTYQSNPGFIGTDTFYYVANDGKAGSNLGTVTVAVIEGPVDKLCVQNNPISQFTQIGKQGTLSITFTGNITSYTNKEIKACPGTALNYKAASSKGPVVCKVKNNTTRGSGSLKINDHIKCTDKPAGKDKVSFKVKSGVK
jgi:hypothetical protein